MPIVPRAAVLFAFTLSAAFAVAQPATPPAQPAAPATETPAEPNIVVPDGLTFDRDVAYGGASTMQRLDILYPADTATSRPLIVHIHGGGWAGGDKRGEKTFAFLRRFVDAGYVAASINYRKSDEATYPAAVDDCLAAVRYLREHAAKYGIDPRAIGATGESAGGHLSAMLGVLSGIDNADASAAIQAAVPVCPPVDLTRPFNLNDMVNDDEAVTGFLGGPIAEHAVAAREASPIHRVTKNSVPMLFVHGDADRRVDPQQSIMMSKALKEAGVVSDVIIVPGGKHGSDVARTDDVFPRVLAFFDAQLRAAQKK